MGACATKPAVSKDDDTNAPLPAPDVSPEKQVGAGDKIDKEIVVDDPTGMIKPRSLSNLFQEGEPGKESSEIVSENPTNASETKSPTEVDSTIKAVAGEKIEIPPVTDTKIPEITEEIKTSKEKKIETPNPETPQVKKPEEIKPVLAAALPEAPKEKKPEEIKPVLAAPLPEAPKEKKLEEIKPVLATPLPEAPKEKKSEDIKPVLGTPLPEAPKEKKPEEIKPILEAPKPVTPQGKKPEEPKPILVTQNPEKLQAKKPEEIKPVLVTPKAEIIEEKKTKDLPKPDIPVEKKATGLVVDAKIEEKPVTKTQKPEDLVEIIKPVTEVGKITKEAPKKPEETKIKK